MTTRLAAAPRNFVLAANTTTASTGIVDTASPTLTVVSTTDTATAAADTITTESNVLPIINATTNDGLAVPIETLVTRDSSSSLCFNGEEYQFITTEQLQDIMTQKTLAADLQHQHQQQQQQQQQDSSVVHHHHHHHPHSHQDEVAVINVVVPMDNADGSSNEAQTTMDTLSAIKEGVLDLAHHTDNDEGCPQFITVTVSAQDAGQNFQVQYVDAEQLYQANSTQTQISYPFCPLQEFQSQQSTYYTTTTAGDFNASGIADLSTTGGEHASSILPYLVPVEESMLINTSSEDIHSSPQTPNSTSTSAMGSQCLNLITDHDDNSMETDHNSLMGSSNKVASATTKWLEQNYETADASSLPRSTLYNHYMQHCNECNIEPVNAASFGKLIRSVFKGLKTRRLGTRGNSKYHYYGIRIRASSLLKHYEEDKLPNSHKISHFTKHSSVSAAVAAAAVTSGMHHNSNAKTHNVTSSDSSPSSGGHGHTARKTSKKIIFKPETFATCSQLLGDGSAAIPCFPLLELDHTFPGEINSQDLELFRLRYQEHCEKFLDAILNLEFNTIEYLWRDFWLQSSDQHHHLDTYLNKTKLDILCLSPTVQKFVQGVDYQFFQNMVDVIIPDVLRSMPNALTQAIRNFASNMEIWLCECMAGVPDQMIQIKTSTVSAFCQTLRRYTSLNHLAQAAKAVLQNSAQISQMLKDLSRVDFHNVQEQAAWVCQCDATIVQRFENDFKTTLQQKSSLEQWASWLQLVVDTALEEHRGKVSYPKAARQFLLKWCLYSSMVIRDLTLRSAPSFGSFHLIRLLYDEYMFYLVEHKIAEAQQKTTIEVICDRNDRNLNMELDYQLEYIAGASATVDTSSSSSLTVEPDTKRLKLN